MPRNTAKPETWVNRFASMTMKKYSLQDLASRPSEILEAAYDSPVFIHDGQRPAYVLLRLEHLRSLTQKNGDIGSLLAMPDLGDFGLNIPGRG